MQSRSRAGFTLIELMVSMALTLVIMTILAQAFVLALDTFSGLKGLGDMQHNLRTASVLLRSDLGSDHFDWGRQLSDPTPIIATTPSPQAGFLSVVHLSVASATAPAPYFVEGLDQNGLYSYRATDHWLYFTVKRKGNRQENFFTAVMQDNSVASTALSPALNAFFTQQTAYNMTAAQLAGATLTNLYPPAASSPQNQGFYGSQWAEVMYYVLPTGLTTDPSIPGSIPTYSLYRAEFVMPPDSSKLASLIASNPQNNSTFRALSWNSVATPGFLSFNSPLDAAKGQRTIDVTAIDVSRLAASSTLVLPNVLSFQVQIMPTGTTNFIDVPGLLYDTARFNTAGYGNNFGLKSIQVTMRVWDAATRQTRQATVIQDL